MARAPKEYTIKVTTVRAFGEDKVQKVSGTLEELIDYYSPGFPECNSES